MVNKSGSSVVSLGRKLTLIEVLILCCGQKHCMLCIFGADSTMGGCNRNVLLEEKLGSIKLAAEKHGWEPKVHSVVVSSCSLTAIFNSHTTF